jgi:N6-L-threonylcarbamoyladenine synthase
LQNINVVFAEAVEHAGISLQDVDEIAVAPGPGLAGALLMGTAFAKAVAFAAGKPLVAVHHIQAHIMAGLIERPDIKPPFVALVVSGGHTHLIACDDYNRFRILGQTRDDAAGEVFDKVARVLDLGYPGGPAIDIASETGNSGAVAFKRVHLEKGSLDFSFSGIKTAAINYIHTQRQKGLDVDAADVAASFQAAVVDVLVDKSMMAVSGLRSPVLVLAGGVASNRLLRRNIKAACEAAGVDLCIPSPVLCTDNAAMVACAAYHKRRQGFYADLYLDVWPRLSLETDLGLLDAKNIKLI